MIIKGSLSLPISDYGKSLGNEASITRRSGFDFGNSVGLAKTGGVFSIDIISPIRKLKGLGWIFSTKLIINPVDTKEIQNYFQSVIKDTPRDTVVFSFESSDWLHIPIMTGFNYGYIFSEDISAYLTIQGGIDISKQPTRKYSAYFRNASILTSIEETKFDFVISYGYLIGIDLEIFNKYSIGIQYLNLGNPQYTGERTLNPSFFNGIFDLKTNIQNDKRQINMLLISFGYRVDI